MIRLLRAVPTTVDWVFHKGTPAQSSYTRKFKLTKWKDMANIFYEYAKNKSEWKDVIELIPVIHNVAAPVEEKESKECFVYLMFDTKSLCFKIGISDLPKWREKTLQSEKPSIKLIAAKKYPNRRIAGSIEKALHDLYSHKRKRGEWFRLDEEDVEEIKATLNN